MKYECNIFKDVWDKDCSNVVGVMSVLKAIGSGKWKDNVLAVREARDLNNKDLVKQLKFRLPAVTFSGVFEEREDNACVFYNNLMVIDIDNITQSRLETLKKELRSNPWVFAFFDGPTKGIKILVFISSAIDWHNTHAFYYLENAFNELYGIQIDPSGKNASRLCFISYDPELYINYNPEVLQIEKQTNELESFVSLKNYDYSHSVPSTNVNYIMDVAAKMVRKSKTGSYHKGNRNNYIFVLSCLLCEFGVNPDMAFSNIVTRYPSLGVKETKAAVASAYRRTMKNFNTRIANQKRNTNQQNLI